MASNVEMQTGTRASLVSEKLARGIACGPAFIEALGEVFSFDIDAQLLRQSLMFTEGGGVKDRCAAFQACVVIVGLHCGRVDSAADRNLIRAANRIIGDTFKEELGSYLCCGPHNCDNAEKERRAKCAARALIRVFQNGA